MTALADADLVVDALRRLHSGDARASRELEAFQASPRARAVSLELLKSVAAEVQFFAACTICRIAAGQSVGACAEDVEWLLVQACGRAHPAAARQLVAAAVQLAGPAGAPALSLRGAELLCSDEHWLAALDLLLALAPPPPLPGVCARLGRLLGRDHDDKLFECALRYPVGIEDSAIGHALEAAVGNGLVHEVPGAAALPERFCRRLVTAAHIAIERGHADAAASVLQELPASATELAELAAELLPAPEVTTRLAAVALWSRALQQLGDAQQCLAAFARFESVFFPAAAWCEGEDVRPLRDALWGLACDWQLSTPSRPTLLPKALGELQAALTGAGDWRRAEAALWLLARYAKGRRGEGDMERVVDACLLVLQQLLTVPGLVPLAASACAVIEALPRERALPVLLDRRLVDPQLRGGQEVRLAVAAALRSCCAVARGRLSTDGTAGRLAEELQARALAGEEELVAAAAQLLSPKDVRPLAEQWARLCCQGPRERAGARARALFSTMVVPDVCIALWRDCASMLPMVPADERAAFAAQIADFVKTTPELLCPALEIWCAVWPHAEGDEDLVLALEQLVQASARTSKAAGPAVSLLISSFAHAHAWATHVVTAAFGLIEATVAPAGSPWPLTEALVPLYGCVLQQAGLLTARHPVAALSLVGALASWDDDTEMGRGLRHSLRMQEVAVRLVVERSEDRRLAHRIAAALGIRLSA